MRTWISFIIFFNLAFLTIPVFGQHTPIEVYGPGTWPWTKPLPFPWKSIEGTWTDKNSKYVFLFEVIENSSGIQFIKIKQIDAMTGRIFAQGTGYENGDKIVVAGMTAGSQKQYLLTVRFVQILYCSIRKKSVAVTFETENFQIIDRFEIFKIREIPLTLGFEGDYNSSISSDYKNRPSCL